VARRAKPRRLAERPRGPIPLSSWSYTLLLVLFAVAAVAARRTHPTARPADTDKEQYPMALSLFARRPEPLDAPAPEPWPQIGESWKPEGVTVIERYYNLAHAVVLVHRSTGYVMVSCLGCHYEATNTYGRYGNVLSQKEASELANTHAGECRALPREIPDRPDDDTVREHLRIFVDGMRKRDEAPRLCLFHFDTQRLLLQRTNEWIVSELERLAADEPGVLKCTVTEWGTEFVLQKLPES
jgi:hypothetical protein